MKQLATMVILGLGCFIHASEPQSPGYDLWNGNSPFTIFCLKKGFEPYPDEPPSTEKLPTFPLPKSTLAILQEIFQQKVVTAESIEELKNCLPPDKDAIKQLQNELGHIGQIIRNLGQNTTLATYHKDLKEVLKIVQKKRAQQKK